MEGLWDYDLNDLHLQVQTVPDFIGWKQEKYKELIIKTE